jgi:hypothetical protein
MTSQVITRSPDESAFFTDQNTKSIALIEQKIYDFACPKACNSQRFFIGGASKRRLPRRRHAALF